jgi:hypothetical protein
MIIFIENDLSPLILTELTFNTKKIKKCNVGNPGHGWTHAQNVALISGLVSEQKISFVFGVCVWGGGLTNSSLSHPGP